MQAITAEAIQATIQESTNAKQANRPQDAQVPRYLSKKGKNAGKWCQRVTDVDNIVPAQRDGKAVYLVRHTFYVFDGPLDGMDAAEKSFSFWYIAPATRTTTAQRRDPSKFTTLKGWTQLDRGTIVTAEAQGTWVPFPLSSLEDVLAAYPTANLSIQS